MKGKIKTLVSEKKFGFITPDDGGNDIFFHESALQGVEYSDLQKDDVVSFEVEQSEKGPRAIQVTRAVQGAQE